MTLARSITPAAPQSAGRGRSARGARFNVVALLQRVAALWRRAAGTAARSRPADGMRSGDGGDWASDALGLDGAPSMVFHDAMPAYSRAIDRPARTPGGAAVTQAPARQERT